MLCGLAKRRALLHMFCGAETFETLRAVVTPRTPGEVLYDQLISLLGSYFDPKPSELFTRCDFQRRGQLIGEFVSKYVASLKTLAVSCNLGVLPIARTPASSGDCAAAPMESASPLSVNTMLPLYIVLR